MDFLVREEVARHVTAMWTLERVAASDWGLTRTLMASINQVTSPPETFTYLLYPATCKTVC